MKHSIHVTPAMKLGAAQALANTLGIGIRNAAQARRYAKAISGNQWSKLPSEVRSRALQNIKEVWMLTNLLA